MSSYFYTGQMYSTQQLFQEKVQNDALLTKSKSCAVQEYESSQRPLSGSRIPKFPLKAGTGHGQGS